MDRAAFEARLWQYRALTIRVIDADSLAVAIDLGFHTWIHARVRLARIDAPERNTAAGRAAATWLRERLADHGNALYVRSLGRDDAAGTWQPAASFERWIAEAWFAWPVGPLDNLSDALVAAGHATYRPGDGPLPEGVS